jgi:eukaryotic-like serine/threonine-protein kinase
MGLFLVVAIVVTGCTTRGMSPSGWSGVVISDDGMAFTGSREGRLVEVNLNDSNRYFADPLKVPASGGSCTSTNTMGSCGGAAPVVAIYGTPGLAEDVPIGLDASGKPITGRIAIVTGYNGVVTAYQSNALANVVWQFTVPGKSVYPIISGVTIYNKLAYFGATDGYIYALQTVGDLSSRTTTIAWKFSTGGYIWSTPSVADGVLVVGSFDKKVYGLDAMTGNKKWEFATGANNVAQPSIADGVAYIGSLDSTFYAIDLQTGQQKWKFKANNWFWAKAAVANSLVFAPCLDKKVYALDVKTGSKMAEYDLAGQIASSPVIVNGKLAVATQNKTMWLIDTAKPQDPARKIADIPADISSSLTARGDTIYINAVDTNKKNENKLFGYNITNGAIVSPISLNY